MKTHAQSEKSAVECYRMSPGSDQARKRKRAAAWSPERLLGQNHCS